MTDLDASTAGTRTCSACGAQNDADRRSCVQCGAELLGGAPPDAVREDGDRDIEVSSGEVDWRHPPPEGSTPEHPLGDDRQFFETAEPGTLAEQRDLLDAEGEDIRQYTGEPVETEEGWVLPQQQNVGPGNEAGGGEWPDPATPSAMPKGDAPPPPDPDGD